MNKFSCLFLLFISLFLVGCSTPSTGKTLEDIQKSANQNIDKGSQSAKNLAEQAIDMGVNRLDGAKKEIAEAAANKAKEKLNEDIDAGTEKLRQATSGAVDSIGNSINKAKDSLGSIKNSVDNGINTAKDGVDQAKSIVAGGYTTYSQTAVDAALKAGKNVILFFHASRCPSCKALEKDILANKASIPSDTVIFKVDYDLNTPLRQTYSVVAQHTLVSLNSDGTKKSMNRGSATLEQVLKNK